MTALRGLLILLICLIILPVLVYSNHFSQETFATDNSGDNENNNDPGQEVSANLGGSEEDEDTEEGLARSDEFSRSDEFAGSEGTGGLTGGSEEIGGVPGPAVDITLDSDTRGLAGAVDGSDVDDDDDRFRHNAEDIAMELSSLPAEEIREYPITDLSDNDIILVFGFLDPGNLTKVLLNIPQEDLADIRDRLTPVTFTESLSRISEVDRSQVANRLVYATTVN